jgi:pyridoxamine 5'-phosphate oxidase
MDKNLRDIRTDYIKRSLDVADVNACPIIQFNQWLDEAVESEVNHYNAMTLATVENNRPKARIVLLKEVWQKQFVFYTNYQSHKGFELAKNSYASLVFFWPELERQIRIEGECSKVASEMSDEYFHSRPRLSRLAAIASNQSQTLNTRSELEQKMHELEQKYVNDTIARPANWGGYALKPDALEFWQGRANRLHDRIHYQINGESLWSITRLSP